MVEFTASVTIGRGDDNDIVLPSPLVSRRHASISQRENGEYILFDHESSNSVWMENRKVNAVRLIHGRSFRIVDHFFTFIDERDESRLSRVFAGEQELPVGQKLDSATILFNPEHHDIEPLAEPATPASSAEEMQLSSLSHFLQGLEELDEEVIVHERLLAGAVEFLRAERGFLALLNQKNDLIYAATHCFDSQKESREIRQDIVQLAMNRKCASRGGGAEAKGERNGKLKTGPWRSVLCAPLLRKGKAVGCLYIERSNQDLFNGVHQGTLEILALQGALILDNLSGRNRMQQERESLKSRLATKDETIICSEKMLKLYEDIRTIASINVPVFISGEAGSGKEHVAAALHSFSERKGAYIPLNCAAIPEGIFESELFGSKKGAFHEAIDKPGKLELAEGGTLFLDEVADMSLLLQPKLLRFLENGEISRLGDTRAKKLNVRVLTATNRDVKGMIREQKFRDDLFQRLSCFTLKVPPLRERLEDIEPLTRYFLKKFSHEYNWKEPKISDNGLQVLKEYQWPGNIRQLRNVLLRLAVQSQGRLITDKDIFAHSEEFGSSDPAKIEVFPNLEEMEKNHIKAALERAAGNISDAAVLVGIARSTLYQKMKKYDIT